MPIPAEQIDPDARKVIRRLVRHNYQAYLVGGCVRDLLLGRKPKDFDIATSATPNEVRALFRNCRIIGRRFRLAHIHFGPKLIETATFRANPRDGEGLDGQDEESDGFERADDDILIRRDNVFGTAEEDARRRDFTINGLFYDIDPDEVIDYVGGLSDLAARTVRTIGDPEIRFREDPVRILRAIKFAARLSFDIDPAAWQGIKDHQGEIAKCAPPRILEEIYRLLRGGAARRSMEILRDTGVLDILIPEVAELLGERPDSQEAAWMWKVLDQLDTQREPVPTNAVLLCALLGPFLGEAVFEEPSSSAPRRDVGLIIDERSRPMLERMRVSRRDVERARQILMTQRRLSSMHKRRGKAPPLKRRDYFEEAMHVHELVGQVLHPDGASLGELQKWRQQLETGEGLEKDAAKDAASDAEADAAADGDEESDERPGRRRRRRGGRRFRRADEAAGVDGARPSGSNGTSASTGQSALAAPANTLISSSPARDEGGVIGLVSSDEESARTAQPSSADQTSETPPSTGSTTPER